MHAGLVSTCGLRVCCGLHTCQHRVIVIMYYLLIRVHASVRTPTCLSAPTAGHSYVVQRLN